MTIIRPILIGHYLFIRTWLKALWVSRLISSTLFVRSINRHILSRIHLITLRKLLKLFIDLIWIFVIGFTLIKRLTIRLIDLLILNARSLWRHEVLLQRGHIILHILHIADHLRHLCTLKSGLIIVWPIRIILLHIFTYILLMLKIIWILLIIILGIIINGVSLLR